MYCINDVRKIKGQQKRGETEGGAARRGEASRPTEKAAWQWSWGGNQCRVLACSGMRRTDSVGTREEGCRRGSVRIWRSNGKVLTGHRRTNVRKSLDGSKSMEETRCGVRRDRLRRANIPYTRALRGQWWSPPCTKHSDLECCDGNIGKRPSG